MLLRRVTEHVRSRNWTAVGIGFLIILVGWVLTDLVIEPRLRTTRVEADPAGLPTQEPLAPHEGRGPMWDGPADALAVVALLLAFWGLGIPLGLISGYGYVMSGAGG